MRRGEIWWASIQNPVGSGPGFRRPVLVVQSNPFNDSKVATVIVAAITSNLRLSEAPGNVRVGRAETGLARPSVVNISQLLSADRALLTHRVGAIPAEAMRRVDEGLRLVLGL
jgi:mRNA interferase MazF